MSSEEPQLITSASDFSIGSVLGRTFANIALNPVVCLVLPLVAMFGPAFIVGVVLLGSSGGESAGTASALGLGIAALIGGIFMLITQGAITYAVYCNLRGEACSIATALGRGLKQMVPLLLTSIVVAFLVGIGLLLFVIPGVILACILSVSIPACVVEKNGVFASLSRSADLTKNFRLKIFLLQLIIGVLSFLLQRLLLNIVPPMGAVSILVFFLITSLPQAFSMVMQVTIYYNLRSIKEGTSASSLASVFD